MRARQLLTLLVALAVVLVAACTRPESPLPIDEQEPKVLNVGATGEPDGMDPITVTGAGTPFVLLYNVYETLVKLDPEKRPQPLLATEWVVSEDGLLYTFTLDRLAKFADGSPVTAEAVVSSFQRILDGDAHGQILADFAPVEEVRAVDERTVEIELNTPSNQFLIALSTPSGIIVNPAADPATLNQTPAGSGPYVLGEWEPGQLVKLTRNTNYWGTPTHFDEVNFRYYADPNAMNTAMLSGQLDIISNLTVPQAITQFEDSEDFVVLEGYTDGEVVLTYNHANPALAVKEVRQALNHAVDRQAVVDAAWGGKGELIGSMVPPTEPWYEDLSDFYPYDPERAKELLAEAGYAEGLTLRLRVPTLPYAPLAARSIQAQLREVGVEAAVEELEFSTWLEQVFANKDYDMTIVAHVEPGDLPMYAMPNNYMNYDNPVFNELIAEADRGTPEEFVEKQKEAARLLTEDAAANWLWLLPNIIITTPEISGVQENQTSLAFDVTTIASSQ
ncbi:ABC transporter substrate-binding protein [Tessaracoccus oleiagri]|uniref:Peptide/nickel transport system substrate-binding protein n=1 Tax=Tessaracoccus oleiagri TaxID=686624 RepID=A0A1G9MNU1_9ACTN|nr:ABC transporter substrate-binding protein [Tessaracoccus oleiagri]SDL75701.1 peptide/nickel transport system substrate-binding protein [Tessaracoccus oleiagri]